MAQEIERKLLVPERAKMRLSRLGGWREATGRLSHPPTLAHAP